MRRATSPVERAFRDASGEAVATLARVFGDLTIAEDAVQDAFVVAVDRWPTEGVPDNPTGWIITTGRRKAIDRIRRANRGRQLEAWVGADAPEQGSGNDWLDRAPVRDDQLRLVFTCCHPALAVEHRIALTLRLIAGLSVEEIARSFLVSEDAMAKRLVRAKAKIKAARIPYRVPEQAELPGRLHAVATVIYLIYTRGADGPENGGLREEAIYLGRSLATLMPDEPEVAGLLAMMLLSEARQPARIVDGELVVLRRQDRDLWDLDLIEEGHRIVASCVVRANPGPFQLQASIQALHCAAPTFADTDWSSVLVTYNQLCEMDPSPVIAMNRAIAVSEVDGPSAGLAILDSLTGDLGEYQPWHAARAALLADLGRVHDAEEAYREAIERTPNDAERATLARLCQAAVDGR